MAAAMSLRNKFVHYQIIRISRVLEDSIKEIETVAMMACLLQELRSGKYVDLDVMAMIEQYEKLSAATDGAEDVEIQAIKKTPTLVLEGVQFIRQLPVISEKFGKLFEHELGSMCPPGMAEFLNAIKAYMEQMQLRFQKLSCPQEKQNKYIVAMGKKDSEIVKTLEKTLQETHRASSAGLKRKKQEIQFIIEQAKQIETHITNIIIHTWEQAYQELTFERKIYEERLTQLQDGISDIKKEMEKLAREHSTAERNLRMKKRDLEEQLESWVNRYDEDMTKTQTELVFQRNRCIAEENEVVRLENLCKELQVKYDQIKERRFQEEEEKEVEREEFELKWKAAVVLQAYWRGYQVRNLLKKTKEEEATAAAQDSKDKRRAKFRPKDAPGDRQESERNLMSTDSTGGMHSSTENGSSHKLPKGPSMDRRKSIARKESSFVEEPAPTNGESTSNGKAPGKSTKSVKDAKAEKTKKK